MIVAPNFIDSEFFVPEFGNWHLKPGAPEDVVNEFEEWKKQNEEAKEKGIVL